ncbi:hypothetical protein E2320_008304, partial [Naja naja]
MHSCSEGMSGIIRV